MSNLLDDLVRSHQEHNAELEKARKDSKRWQEEWQAVVNALNAARETTRTVEGWWGKARQEAEQLHVEVSRLKFENEQLRQLAQADSVQILLLERRIERLERKTKETTSE